MNEIDILNEELLKITEELKEVLDENEQLKVGECVRQWIDRK